jgi:hypothetical protein
LLIVAAHRLWQQVRQPQLAEQAARFGGWLRVGRPGPSCLLGGDGGWTEVGIGVVSRLSRSRLGSTCLHGPRLSLGLRVRLRQLLQLLLPRTHPGSVLS